MAGNAPLPPVGRGVVRLRIVRNLSIRGKIFAGYIARAIVRPVRRVAAMAGRLAGGDLAARLPEAATGEIGSLERSFNIMARSLEANRDDLTRLLREQAALRRVATLVAGACPGPRSSLRSPRRSVG